MQRGRGWRERERSLHNTVGLYTVVGNIKDLSIPNQTKDITDFTSDCFDDLNIACNILWVWRTPVFRHFLKIKFLAFVNVLKSGREG